MAAPIKYLQDGVLHLDYAILTTPAFYEVVKGPNSGIWVHINNVLN